MATGSTGYFAISKETAFKTEVTVPEHFYPVEEVDITSESKSIDIKEIRGSRQAYNTQPGAIEPQVTAKAAIYPSGALAVILEGLLGKKASSAPIAPSTIAYRHTFADAPVLPSFTVERSTAFSDDAGAFTFCQRVAGAKVESLKLDLKYNELVELNLTMQGAGKPNIAGAPVARAAALFPTMDPLYFGGSVIKVGGTVVSLFESLSVEITNKLDRQNVLNGEVTSYKISEGGVECKLSGQLTFEDVTFYNHWVNADVFSVALSLNNNQFADQANAVKYGMDFTWDRVEVASHKTPFQAGDVIRADVEFRVLYNQAQARSVSVDIVNLDDGTTY